MKAAAAAVLVCAVLALPSATAHQALPEPVREIVELSALSEQALPVREVHEHDTLALTFRVIGDAVVTARLEWVDDAGVTHVASTVTAGSGDMKFKAGGPVTATRLVLTTDAESGASVHVEYLSSQSFWRNPVLVMGAGAPFIILGLALGGARLAKPYLERVGGGPVRPPGWEKRDK